MTEHKYIGSDSLLDPYFLGLSPYDGLMFFTKDQNIE
jgi:hypothetical protein